MRIRNKFHYEKKWNYLKYKAEIGEFSCIASFDYYHVTQVIWWKKQYPFHSQIPLILLYQTVSACRKNAHYVPVSSGKWKKRNGAMLYWKVCIIHVIQLVWVVFFSTLVFFLLGRKSRFFSLSLDTSIDEKFGITMNPAVFLFFQVHKICCGVDSWFCHQLLLCLYASCVLRIFEYWKPCHKCFAWNGVEYEVLLANTGFVSSCFFVAFSLTLFPFFVSFSVCCLPFGNTGGWLLVEVVHVFVCEGRYGWHKVNSSRVKNVLFYRKTSENCNIVHFINWICSLVDTYLYGKQSK